MTTRLLGFFIITIISTASHIANAATIDFSNSLYRSWNAILLHEVGAGNTINDIIQDVYSSNTGSIGPVIYSNDTSYGSAYASSDFLSLYNYSSIDGGTLDQQVYDYAIAEATTRFEADFVISGDSGKALLNIDALYNQTQIFNPTAYLYGEQRIRIFDGTGDLVLAYLRGVNDYVLDDALLLNFDETYRFSMSSTAYAKVDAGYNASNQREFSATVSAVSAVPIPAALYLFLTGIATLYFSSHKSKNRST